MNSVVGGRRSVMWRADGRDATDPRRDFGIPGNHQPRVEATHAVSDDMQRIRAGAEDRLEACLKVGRASDQRAAEVDVGLVDDEVVLPQEIGDADKVVRADVDPGEVTKQDAHRVVAEDAMGEDDVAPRHA